MDIAGTRTEGLGDSTYLFTHGGVSALVDPQRDYLRFLDPLEASGSELRLIFETHVHNDYVSGGLPAATATGADLVLPAGAGAAFSHRPAFHGEDIDAGPFVVRPLHTPGHTPEHVSYLFLVDGVAVAVFTGGSLLVGAAGRTDLLGVDRARQLARLQYGSVHRIADLPPDVGLYPTHGEGSFCAASGAGRHTSTVLVERQSNPVLKHPDADSFADEQLAGLGPYPTYYSAMGPINLSGPPPLPGPAVPILSIAEVEASDARLIDIRPRESFASAHIPDSVGVELSDQFGTWVGWLIDIDTPVVLVAGPDQEVSEAVIQLARIGIDDVRGVFTDIEGWVSGGREAKSYREVSVETFKNALADGRASRVLDVRAPNDWEFGTVPGSVLRYVPDLAGSPPDELSADADADADVWVACGSGYRATIAAGLLERHGITPVVLSRGGVPDLL